MSLTYQHDLSLSDLFKGDLQFASPPNIYFELQKVAENPNKSMSDAAFIIEKDAGLSIRLLKIVNSAFYGFPSQITSIGRAITLIGLKELQNIILATVVIERFSTVSTDLVSMHDFWASNLRCALIAQEIDLFLNYQYSDSVFICGLLHHIGSLVLLRRVPELMREVYLLTALEDNLKTVDEIKIEHRVLGFDHYEVGAELTKLWQLSALISDSIRLHAYPETTEDNKQIAAIIRSADSYSKMDGDFHGTINNTLGIADEQMSTIVDKAYDKFEEIFKVFYPG